MTRDRDAARAEVALDETRHGLGGAHEDGDLALGRTGGDCGRHRVADERSFVARRCGATEDEFAVCVRARPQLRAGLHGARERTDVFGAAETVGQRQAGHCERCAGPLECVACGAAKAVDCLRGIADGEHGRAEAPKQFELQGVRVLELVDEDVAIAAVQRVRDGAAGRLGKRGGARTKSS